MQDHSGDEIIELVLRLAQKSLVATDVDDVEPRFRLLETTRAYALEKLVNTGEHASVARRHSEYYSVHAEDMSVLAVKAKASILPIGTTRDPASASGEVGPKIRTVGLRRNRHEQHEETVDPAGGPARRLFRRSAVERQSDLPESPTHTRNGWSRPTGA